MMSFVCYTNATTNEDVEAMVYSLFVCLFGRLRKQGVFCVAISLIVKFKKNSGLDFRKETPS